MSDQGEVTRRHSGGAGCRLYRPVGVEDEHAAGIGMASLPASISNGEKRSKFIAVSQLG
jgi:hypothetical protein